MGSPGLTGSQTRARRGSICKCRINEYTNGPRGESWIVFEYTWKRQDAFPDTWIQLSVRQNEFTHQGKNIWGEKPVCNITTRLVELK